jgi:CubicO group peptidase (beta-lactamase class C family)
VQLQCIGVSVTRLWMQALAALLLLAAPAVAQTPLERRIDAYVAPLVAGKNFSGVILVARGDKLLAERSYGLASEELGVAHRPDDRFQIASVSKPITAAAVLKLVQAGKIDLAAPISTYVPDYPNGGAITVRNLLTHTSGVANVNELPVYRELGLKRRTPAEIMAAFKDAKPMFAPGANLGYSNSNFALLALIVEKTSGMAYGDYLQREIFAPIGMTRSGHRGDDAVVLPGMTQGYATVGRTALARPAWFDWTVKTGNGSLYSTARDLHRFVSGYFGGRLIGAELLRAATTPAPDLPPRARGFEWMPTTVGYGWLIDRHLGHRRLFHSGSSPGFSTTLAYYPDDQLTVVVLSSIYAGTAQPVGEAAAAMAFGQEPGPPLRRDDPLPAAEIARFVGAYRFGADFRAPGATVSVFEEAGRLWLRTGQPGAPPQALLPKGPLAFIAREGWNDVVFEAQPGAKATAARMGAGSLGYRAERVPSAP